MRALLFTMTAALFIGCPGCPPSPGPSPGPDSSPDAPVVVDDTVPSDCYKFVGHWTMKQTPIPMAGNCSKAVATQDSIDIELSGKQAQDSQQWDATIIIESSAKAYIGAGGNYEFRKRACRFVVDNEDLSSTVPYASALDIILGETDDSLGRGEATMRIGSDCLWQGALALSRIK